MAVDWKAVDGGGLKHEQLSRCNVSPGFLALKQTCAVKSARAKTFLRCFVINSGAQLYARPQLTFNSQKKIKELRRVLQNQTRLPIVG